MSIDVLCAGLIVADHVSSPLAAFPPAGGLATVDRLELTTGGCAANVAVDLAKLGLKPALGGRIGDDALGRFATEALAAQGVDCSTVSVSTTAQTSATLVVNVAGEDRRFLHAVGANAEFTGEEVSDDAVRSSRAVYVGGFGLNAALSGERVARLFQRAHEAGALTVLDVVVADPGLIRDLLPAALAHADLFLPNTDEARIITGIEDPLEQARHFHAAGAKCVVITCGSRGLVLVDEQGVLRASAHDVKCVDGTGGGDAFVAGFLYGRLKGCDAARCIEYGSAMGASCVRAMGATTGVFNAEELEQFVAEHPLKITRG
jgi:sugar/nucleoside kinase (ribokinase family)